MISSWHKGEGKVFRTTIGTRVCRRNSNDTYNEVIRMKKENPYIYNRQIADALGVSEYVVTRALRKMKLGKVHAVHESGVQNG